jgi:flagellar basal body-associated protein FliL
MDNDNSKILEQQTHGESTALNRITLDLLEQKKKENFRLWIIIFALIVVNLLEVGAFFWYESTMEVTETTTTTTVEQDTGEGEGNNVYQSGEQAQYHEKGD